MRGSAALATLTKVAASERHSRDTYSGALSKLRSDKRDYQADAMKSATSAKRERLTGVQASRISLYSDINFIRKEFVYTKLKYSRSPAYDAVSGGFAALLAGFIGFLISEKFGIELVDSGDFFIGFMYATFLVFIGRMVVHLTSDVTSPRLLFSLRHNLTFFREIGIFTLRRLINIFK